jgi:hypothetical protein
MAREIIELVKCDRCGKKMDGPSRVNDKVDADAPPVEPKFRIQVLRATGDQEGSLALATVASYFDVCESCDTYVRKQLDYILLTRKRGRKPKVGDKPKRAKKAKAPQAKAAPTAASPFPKATENGGDGDDKAKVVD